MTFGAKGPALCGPCEEQYQREDLTERSFVRAFEGFGFMQQAGVQIVCVGASEVWVPSWAYELSRVFAHVPRPVEGHLGAIMRRANEDPEFREACSTIIMMTFEEGEDGWIPRAEQRIRSFADSQGVSGLRGVGG